MAINLNKGQSIQLDKKINNLSRVTMGLGWDVRKPVKKGFFGAMFGGGGADFDLDAFAILLGSNDRLAAKNDLIYFGNLSSRDGTVVHSGDNLTGEGEGDDETLVLQLGKMAEQYQRIAFGVLIYKGHKRAQHFGMVSNAFVRTVDADGKEMARFQLSSDAAYEGKVSMLLGDLVRKGGAWDFRALGQPMDVADIDDLTRHFA